MTLHFHSHFEVFPPKLLFFFPPSFAPPNVRRVYACVRALGECVGMYSAPLYLFSAVLRALCLQGLAALEPKPLRGHSCLLLLMTLHPKTG